MDPVNVPAKFEVRRFTRSRENRGYSKKFGQSLDTPTLSFLPHFSWAFVQMEPKNVSNNFKFAVRSFSHSCDNSDCSFGLGLRTRDLGEGKAVGVGDGTVRKSVCDFL